MWILKSSLRLSLRSSPMNIQYLSNIYLFYFLEQVYWGKIISKFENMQTWAFSILDVENFWQATVSRLPDQGAKLQKQISELNLELNQLRMEKTTQNEVIDLDDLTGDLQRVLNV